MSNEKTEFDSKGLPKELIIDSGNSYQNKALFRADYKGLVERNFQKAIEDNYQGDIPEENNR